MEDLGNQKMTRSKMIRISQKGKSIMMKKMKEIKLKMRRINLVLILAKKEAKREDDLLK